ncbi:M16 family metallopeptidase [Mucilaginibacter celer]|uniref:Insulinase family protein n=1 Tax=Mucilaginibacter celer TaxID=2305508 RepID=A0A494VIC6_9SPHI|nr:insulinase family protein [Mucilaginibacter celer]AYL93884.1 insulinase family protein [Mucilaginibacter celer]
MKNIKSTILLASVGIALSWSFTAAPTWAQVAKPKVVKTTTEKNLPLDPAVRTGKLPNGFTYYIRHNEEPKKRVTFYLANKVGSVLEDDTQRGLAHFMEHMSFNGTKNFPKNELVSYLQKSGVRFGADLNAYTSFDETVYQLPLPSDNPDILKNGIQIMRDWAQDATLDVTEINKERGVVLEEKRLGKGAQERMQRQYLPTILNHSRYSLRLPIGTDEVLNNFKPETIKKFYHDWYRPDLQALIVVGDIDVDQMEKTIKAKFSDLKNPAGEKPRTKYTVPLLGQNQFLAVTDKEMTVTVAQVMMKQPAAKLHTAADYRDNIVRGLFNRMTGARYAEIMRQANPPYLQGGAEVGDFLGGLDNYSLYAVAKPGELENGFKAAWRETERIKRFGFTQTELDRAKQAYLSDMEASLKEKNKTNSDSYVNEYLQYFLKGTAAPGISYEYDLVKNDLPGVTLDEVNAVSKSSIKNTNRDLMLLAPEKDKATLPTEAVMNSWIKAVEGEDLKPYNDEVSKQPLLANAPVAGKITAETKDAALGTTTLTLSNGVKVVLKPTDFKDNEILFSASSPGGTSLYSDADYQSAANASGMIESFGLGNYNPTQLEKYLSGKQLSVSPYISERTQGVSGNSTPKDLESAFELIYGYLTEPRKDADLFQGIITRSKASLANRGNDPNAVFQDTLSATLGNYNVRRTGPSIAKIDQINLDREYTIYKERFADASGMTFTFVGNIDIEKIKPLIEKYIASLPSKNLGEKAKDLGIHIPEGKIAKNVYKGSEPKATVDMVWSGPFEYSAAERIQLDALKECLEIRLIERLREDESGVYSPGAYANNSKFPTQRYSMFVYFGCDPKNADKLVASTLDEINKLKTNGPAQVNIDKWRAESIRTRETSVRTNGFWLGYISGQINDKEDLHQIDSYTKDLNSVTIESVKATAQKYLSGKNFIRMQLLPETK